MKKSYLILFTGIIIAASALFVVSCKKDKTNPQGCPVESGFGYVGPTLMFWVSKDYAGGIYNVKVLDENGKSIDVYYNQITVFDTVEPDACNSAAPSHTKHAIFLLAYGHTYSYTAISDNRVFKGTITTPCSNSADVYSCKSIQIDHQ